MPVTPLTLEDALDTIRALSNLHGTGSTPDEEYALDAFQRGQPSFWTKAGYSNQLAGILLETANRHGLETALARCANDAHSLYLRHTPYLLGTLIPLNKQAVEALNTAWHEYATVHAEVRRARAAHPAPMFDDALQAAE